MRRLGIVHSFIIHFLVFAGVLQLALRTGVGTTAAYVIGGAVGIVLMYPLYLRAWKSDEKQGGM